jgi:hypothetical protein
MSKYFARRIAVSAVILLLPSTISFILLAGILVPLQVYFGLIPLVLEILPVIFLLGELGVSFCFSLLEFILISKMIIIDIIVEFNYS